MFRELPPHVRVSSEGMFVESIGDVDEELCGEDAWAEVAYALQDALREALSMWESRSFRSKMAGGPGKSIDEARIEGLRAKFLGGK
jgi:hypothetical protein